jgi:acetyl-CoA carboxylase biotin carboxyl carrier protein
MDLKEIQALIKFVAKSGAQEVSLETEDFKINIKTGPDASEQPTIIQAVAPQQMPALAGGGAPAASSRSSTSGAYPSRS